MFSYFRQVDLNKSFCSGFDDDTSLIEESCFVVIFDKNFHANTFLQGIFVIAIRVLLK